MTSPLLAAFDQQVAWCTRGGAPFTAQVLARSRAWLAATPDAHAALAAIDAQPLQAAVALRWAAALHLLALQGLPPWATLWTGAGGADDTLLDSAIALAWRTQQPLLRDMLSRPPQTNEVQRSAALLPGLLHVAQRTGLPLALLEIGASSGLNLWCDRYRHVPQAVAEPAVQGMDNMPAGANPSANANASVQLSPSLISAPTPTPTPASTATPTPADDGAPESPPWTWGPEEAPLTLCAAWSGSAPWAPAATAPALQVLHRAACDADPIDLRDPAQALRGASYIWPDQPGRLTRLRAAQAAAARWMAAEGLGVQRQAAADFVAQALARRPAGAVTVLMHSIVWQYIAPAEQQAITQAMEAAGRAASPAQPLAWLRLEPPRPDLRVELRCRLWPGGDDALLALAHPHGASVAWQAPSIRAAGKAGS